MCGRDGKDQYVATRVPPAPDDRDRPRPQLNQPPVDAVPRRLRADLAEQFREPFCVDLGAELGVREDGLRLGSEQHAVRPHRVVQRLDAEPVAGQQQLLPPPVPEPEREHAVQVIHAVAAPLQVAAQQHLGV